MQYDSQSTKLPKRIRELRTSVFFSFNGRKKTLNFKALYRTTRGIKYKIRVLKREFKVLKKSVYEGLKIILKNDLKSYHTL